MIFSFFLLKVGTANKYYEDFDTIWKFLLLIVDSILTCSTGDLLIIY